MNIKQYLVRNFSYDHWANRECLSAIAAANPMPPKALRFMAHTISAQKLWLERLQGEPQTIAVWPTFTIEECSTLVNEMQPLLAHSLAASSVIRRSDIGTT